MSGFRGSWSGEGASSPRPRLDMVTLTSKAPSLQPKLTGQACPGRSDQPMKHVASGQLLVMKHHNPSPTLWDAEYGEGRGALPTALGSILRENDMTSMVLVGLRGLWVHTTFLLSSLGRSEVRKNLKSGSFL
jgi:hypothetical protein